MSNILILQPLTTHRLHEFTSLIIEKVDNEQDYAIINRILPKSW